MEPDGMMEAGMWAVVRIYGAGCLKKVAELQACGAEVYCPVVKERRRIGRTRGKFEIVERAAYQGWAFMRGEPRQEDLAKRPWLSFKVLGEFHELVHDHVIEKIRAEEAVWNMAVANHDPSQRKKLSPGQKVKVTAGMLRGMLFEVKEDEGDWVSIKPVGQETNIPTKINPFLLEPVGA